MPAACADLECVCVVGGGSGKWGKGSNIHIVKLPPPSKKRPQTTPFPCGKNVISAYGMIFTIKDNLANSVCISVQGKKKNTDKKMNNACGAITSCYLYMTSLYMISEYNSWFRGTQLGPQKSTFSRCAPLVIYIFWRRTHCRDYVTGVW